MSCDGLWRKTWKFFKNELRAERIFQMKGWSFWMDNVFELHELTRKLGWHRCNCFRFPSMFCDKSDSQYQRIARVHSCHTPEELDMMQIKTARQLKFTAHVTNFWMLNEQLLRAKQVTCLTAPRSSRSFSHRVPTNYIIRHRCTKPNSFYPSSLPLSLPVHARTTLSAHE